MTRINVVPVQQLTKNFLISEYREITRLPGNLTKSLSRTSKPFNLSEIPANYTMGKGHVKFFYNKFKWLQKRFESLVAEMIRRGYNPTYRDSNLFTKVDVMWYNDWEPSEADLEVNIKRIQERTSKYAN